MVGLRTSIANDRRVTGRYHAFHALAETVFAEHPLGLLVLSCDGEPLWHNPEAELVCAIWNRALLRGDALPLERFTFAVPLPLWQECQALARIGRGVHTVSESDRGLHALIRLHTSADETCFLLQLDYRRPRGDRDHPISPAGLALLHRLSFREREVALRLRDGLTNCEIARELRRSPLTIKTQTAGVLRKLEVPSRARAIVLLNR